MTDNPAGPSKHDLTQQDKNPEGESLTPSVSNLTPDSRSVQGQEAESQAEFSEPSHEQAASQAAASGQGEGYEETEIQRLNREILTYKKNLSELLKSNEVLKLEALGMNINLAYYDLWCADANLLFQRCVILKKRLQKYAKEKGA